MSLLPSGVRALAFASLSLVAACSVPLNEGHFGCERGPCPSSFYCHSDKLCYATPEDALDSGVLPPGDDAWTGLDANASPRMTCTALTPCASGLCYFPNGEAYETGYCTPMCTTPSTCPADATLCRSNACVVPCSSRTLCPTSMRCALRDRSAGECLPSGVAPLPLAATPCTGGSPCEVGVCSQGMCRRPCLNDAGCPDNERCASTTSADVCLPR